MGASAMLGIRAMVFNTTFNNSYIVAYQFYWWRIFKLEQALLS